MKRTLFVLLAALVGAGVAFAALDAAAQHGAETPQAQAADPTAPEARRADIAVFRETFMTRERSYSHAARAEAETRLAALESQAGSVS